MSVLLRPDEGVAPFDLTVATALAAADACKVVAEVDPRLKWPNDLVVMGRKLAGILAEIVTVSPSDPVGRDAVVVGLGLNVNWAPPDEEMSEEKRSGTKRPLFATSLALTSGLTGRIDVDPKDPKDADQIDTDKLLTEVLEHLDRRITDLSEQQGATEQMKEYRSRSALIGKEVVIYVPEGQVRGVVANVSDDGHLVVTCNDRDTNRLVNRVFTTGDVFGVGTVSYGPLPASGRA
jgi:BirA family biotin operon repressor/biotin-[acetyl-CoA-carboxylase] ligase